MTVPRALPVYRVAGSQRAMGHQLGDAMRSDGAVSLAHVYRTLPQRMILGAGGGNVEERAALPVLEVLFGLAIARLEARRDDELRTRSRAFLEAIGDDPDHSRFLNVMDLFQNVVGVAGRLGLLRDAGRLWTGVPPACSTFAAWGDATRDGELLHARNFDFPGIGIWDAAPCVVFCSPPHGQRYGYVGTCGADLPGVTAFNEAGITVTAHTRLHQRVRFDGHTIVDLGHEIARRARCLDDAVRIARSRPVASTWGLAVSSRSERRAISIETHGQDVAVVEAETGVPWITCTNRYRHARTQSEEVLLCSGWACSSDGREAVLRRDASRHRGALDGARLQAMLGSHEDPDVEGYLRTGGPVPAQACTVQSVVIEPHEGVLHVAVGRASTAHGPWATVALDWDATDSSADAAAPSRHAFATGARGVAHAHWVDATRRAEEAEPIERIEHVLLSALGATPHDPSLHFMLAGAALRQSRPSQALGHLNAALGGEQNPVIRGQLHLWASRAATATGRTPEAEVHRRALLSTADPRLSEERRCAERERRRPLRAATFRRLKVAPELLDIVIP